MSTALISEILSAVSGDHENPPPDQIKITGEGGLFSYFPVTDLAAATMGAAGLMVHRLAGLDQTATPSVIVDKRLASMWFGWTLRPEGWEVPGAWNAIAGDYRTRDGWIKLHTNAPHHRTAAVKTLGVREDRDAVAKAVAAHDAAELEQAIVDAGGCAAELRSLEDWAVHPQGQAVAGDPLILWQMVGRATPMGLPDDPSRPLKGIRILDLTRVLAGPVSSRFLAGYGADVLRIDPPDWDEPGVIPEVTLGKRCAGLDLRLTEDRKRFEELLVSADLMLHGYRPGALSGLGYGLDDLRKINPSLVDVCLDAYGWNGPWAGRRGFDSLVQMSSGIAEFGMKQSGADHPVPLPVQALDHATGYLIAAAALHALDRRARDGEVLSGRLSLARTSKLLADHRQDRHDAEMAVETGADLDARVEQTSWGPARRIKFPVNVSGAPAHWPHPATALRTAAAEWQ